MDNYINYGIDLGTTNSAIASCEGLDVRIFPNNLQMNVTPSVVRILKTGRIIVGQKAYNAIMDDHENIAPDFKRWMGQKDTKRFPASGSVMTAEELSAEVLKSLREDVFRLTGDEVRSAVVTVPAAFGSLQCEATARAAKLAGFDESPLLQEPIAAAIAYGVAPGAKDQYWLVFDLGGGTLDIAVISTRAGRLSVREHRGHNQLGGKDIDRLVVGQFLFPSIRQKFSLPDEDSPAFGRLYRRLIQKAEEIKIELTTKTQVMVSLFDLGEDLNGEPIELEFPMSRDQLERKVDPFVEKCLGLAEEALEGARLSVGDLDRILLVGGPTQMPVFRTVLSERLGAKVDFSIDPMTVVARGAAIYAATVEQSIRTPKTGITPGKISVILAFDPVCASLQCPVAGRVEASPTNEVCEMRIDMKGGFWTSGWFPLSDGHFEIAVTLQEGKLNCFWLYARDKQGSLLEVEPDAFRVRHGLELSAPPLPHTISVEIDSPDGNSELTPVFPRTTPLPTEKSFNYRAAHTLRPSEPGSSLAIKLWEGEEFSDPEANEWLGNIYIRASEEIRRPIPEGSEIELMIRIDKSRRISVEAFVPHLNQHFSGSLYIPGDEQDPYIQRVEKVNEDVRIHLERLRKIEPQLKETGNEKALKEIERLKRDAEDLDIEAASFNKSLEDPDQAKRLVETSRNIRKNITKLGRDAGIDIEGITFADAEDKISSTQEIVEQFGSSAEKREFELLRRELERSTSKRDHKTLQKTINMLDSLKWRVLFKQEWYWRNAFKWLREPERQFLNEREAKRLIVQGEEAINQGDIAILQKTVRNLWELLPRSSAEAIQEQALRSGLRKY
ncbi:MAG: Hsp70 family protein [Desulfobaccales bacterium]